MTDCVHLDIETFSECDLKKCGAYRYAEDPSTEVLCICYAFGDGPVKLWKPGDPLPEDLYEHVRAGRQVRAHNAQFERTVLNGVAGRKIGFPRIEIPQCVCTAAKARAHGLPGALGDCAAALGTHPKDEGGRNVMLQLARPRGHKTIKRWTPENAPEKFKILYDYCMDDVRAEQAIDQKVQDLTPYEQKIWELDQKINDRGVQADIESVRNAQSIVDQYKALLLEICVKKTGVKPTQREEIANWVRTNGYPQLENLQADTVLKACEDPECPEPVREILKLYSTYGMKAVSKLEAIERAVCSDGRLHGMFMYYGAGPGRWSSSIVQLQNMARPKIKDPDIAIEAFLARNLEWVEFLYPSLDPMKVVASCIRGMLTGGEGKVIQALDFAGIESRWTAWMFDENWKLEAFEQSDRDEGPDTYKMSYGNMFGVDPNTIGDKDDRRQVGKVVELAFGYEGGVAACITAAATYGFDIEELAEQALRALSPEYIESAEWMWSNFEVPRGRPSGLPRDIYVGLDGLKQSWRAAHPNIKAGWRALIDAAKAAVEQPGTVFMLPNRKIRFLVQGDFLYMRLPSGRRIAYYKPELSEDRQGRISLTYMGMDTETRQWRRTATYGGRLTENAAQGGSSDLLRHGMLNLEAAGYPAIMTVHDEVCSEIDPGFGSLAGAERVFIDKPKWANGLPLAAEGWRAKRYRK